MKIETFHKLSFLAVASLLPIIILTSSVQALDEPAISKLSSYVESTAKRIGRKSTLALEVRDLNSGKVLLSKNGSKNLVPASVAKLFTSVLALKVLGGSYRFPFEVFSDRKPGPSYANSRSKGAVGNLYLRGYGDPTIVDERVWFFVKTLKEQGVEELDNLVLDDTLFINPPSPEGPRAYNAGLGALTVNHNSYAVHVFPGSKGGGAIVSATPGAPFELETRVKTVAGRGANIAVLQSPKSTAYRLETRGETAQGLKRLDMKPLKLVVRGTIGERSKGKTIYRSAPHPTVYFAGVFDKALKRAGIQRKGEILLGQTPGDANLLKSFESKELALILRELNQYSNNITAGQILFLLGQDENGYFRREVALQRINQLIDSLAVGPGKLRDGSGLSRENSISVAHLTKLLVYANSDYSIGPELISSLSRFKRSGTLKKRRFGGASTKAFQKSGNIWGKTGTLNGVSSLSGYLQMNSGRRVAYAIIVNGALSKADASKVEERIVEILLGVA